MKPYTILKLSRDNYCLVNPSGVWIAWQMSWRVARDLCDLKNDQVEWDAHARAVTHELGWNQP